MPKMKTHKAAAKRIKVTKNGKFLKRAAGQDHFNARDTGQSTMRKRRDVLVPHATSQTLKSLLPYN